MECWPPARRAYASERILGMKSGKRSILQKMLYLHFMMMPIRHPFSAFTPENMPILRENQYNYIRFDTLNPPLQYSRTHDSIIPIAERSGAKFKYIFRLGQIRALRIVVPCQTFSSGVITNSEIHH